jgi:hypothetical protein
LQSMQVVVSVPELRDNASERVLGHAR